MTKPTTFMARRVARHAQATSETLIQRIATLTATIKSQALKQHQLEQQYHAVLHKLEGAELRNKALLAELSEVRSERDTYRRQCNELIAAVQPKLD